MVRSCSGVSCVVMDFSYSEYSGVRRAKRPRRHWGSSSGGRWSCRMGCIRVYIIR